MSQQIQVRRGLAATWTSVNPVLAQGEMGFETDTGQFKFGDGALTWAGLDYAGGGVGGLLNDLTDVTITSAASGDILRHNGTAWVDAVGTAFFEVAGAAAAAQAAAIAASQPVDADLTAIAASTTTAFGRARLTDADAAALRTAAGVGTISTQAASAVAITGGTVTGITDLAVADGGTGASTAAAARTNLGLVIGTDVMAFSATDMATQAELDAHVNDTTAAHAATAIAFTPTGTIAATTVQAAIAEVAAEAGGASTLDGLTDVNTAGQATGEVLTYDGTTWVPDAITMAFHDATTATPATGDYVTGSDTSATDANAKFLVSGILALAPGAAGGTDVAVADGGTGASTAAAARTNLGLVIGTDVAAATAVARANHTGTQLAATISDLSTATYVPAGTDVAVADGGTGASTAAAARTNLGLVIGTDVQAQGARVTFSNAAYTVVATSGTFVAQTGTMSASRVVTLPLASAFRVGDVLTILDESGTVSATNTIVVTRAGSDTIGGATTVTIAAPYGWRRLVSDGVSKWSFDGGVLRAASNLSDLTDAAAARTNLGLGNLAAATTLTEYLCVAISDETTAITTGTAKITFRMPFAMTVTAVRASLATASSSGIPTFDINEAGTTILSTKLTIDATELTSTTAAVAAVISDTALADDAEITIDVDVAGTGAKGAKIWIIGTRVV